MSAEESEKVKVEGEESTDEANADNAEEPSASAAENVPPEGTDEIKHEEQPEDANLQGTEDQTNAEEAANPSTVEQPEDTAQGNEDEAVVEQSKPIKAEEGSNVEVSKGSKGQVSDHTVGKQVSSQEQAKSGQISEKSKTSPAKGGSIKSASAQPSKEVAYTRSSILDGLEQAEKQAAVTTEEIMQLKNKIIMYQQKGHLSQEDIAEMQETQAELMEKLAKYGDTSNYLAGLIGMTQVPSSQLDMSVPPVPRKPALPRNDKTTSATVQQIVGIKEKATIGPPIPGVKEVDDICLERYSEEKLPRVIVCGIDSIDQVPKIIVCEPLKDADTQPFQRNQRRSVSKTVDIQPSPISGRPPSLTTSYGQNKQVPPTQPSIIPPVTYSRNPLEDQLNEKQHAIEKLQAVIKCLKDKVCKLNEENTELHKQQAFSSQPPQAKICRRELYQTVRKTLPSFEKRNGDDFEEHMEQPKEDALPNESTVMQDKRLKPDMQPQCMNFGQQTRCKRMLPVKETQTHSESEKDKQMRLFEEQYKKLNKDFNKKVAEMAILKVELDKTRKEVENSRNVRNEIEQSLENSLETINKLESEKSKLLHFKEQYEDMEQDANLAKQMYITGQDELEESRMLFEDVSKQVEEYRRKYLYTLTTLEEEKKDMDRKYQEHEEQVAEDIKRTKLELQEMEEELKTKRYMLKEGQHKLKETQQMHAIALNNIKDLSQDLQNSKKEIDRLKEALNRSNIRINEEKIAALEEKLRFTEKKAESLDLENERLMSLLSRIEETALENERHLEEKTHETKLLQAQMETLREESARQISRSKSASEAMKSSMQIQISKLETELIETRTTAYVAKQDKIAIQKKMQAQIAHLNSTTEETRTGVLSLERHVNYLKETNICKEIVTLPQSDGDACPCPPRCHKPPFLKPELIAPDTDLMKN